jgi:hypothetical protein
MKLRPSFLPIVLAAALALAVGGCGGGGDKSSSTAASTGTTTTADSSQGQPGNGTATEGSGSSAAGNTKQIPLGSPSDVPRSKGGDNSIQDYGSEASTADRAAAGLALQTYYDALQSGDTEAACALLSSRTREGIQQTLQQLQGGADLPKTCPDILKITAGAGSRSPQRRITELLSLRTQGDGSFLIYTARDGRVYSIAMAEESGDWRVGGVSASPLAT